MVRWPSRRISSSATPICVDVGRESCGFGTTVSINPVSSVPSAFDLKFALTYDLSSRLKLQLTGGNLLNRTIYDPGVESPGFGFAPRLPQPGRTFYLRLISSPAS